MTYEEPSAPEDPQATGFLHDAPLQHQAEDAFGRWVYAQRLAESLARRTDDASIVVGVCGRWGEGKTTILNYVEAHLGANHPDTIVVRFNPWMYPAVSSLVAMFFATLAEAVGAKLTSRKEDFAKVLSGIGDAMSAVTVAAEAASVSGGAFKGLAQFLGESTLATQRERLSEALREEGKRVVVMVDDIDRLDGPEIATLVKLIKLVADVPRVTYVLALDPAMVASALEAHTSVGDGQQYLEKIIQVNLQIPRTDPEVVRDLLLRGIDRLLKQVEIDLDEQEVVRFRSSFDRHLAPHIATVRTAKRVINVIDFALPTLADEVNVVDLLLLETMRVVMPQVHDRLARSRDLLIQGAGLATHRQEERCEAIRQLVTRGAGQEGALAEDAKRLLIDLFPRVGPAFGEPAYGSDFTEGWCRERRATCWDYFDRYFSYGVPERDVADSVIGDVVEVLDRLDLDAAEAALRRLSLDGKAELVVRKLRRFETSVNQRVARGLILAFARVSDDLPNPTTFLARPPMEQAAISSSFLVEQVPAADRYSVLEAAMVAARRVTYAAALERWLRVRAEQVEGLLSERELVDLRSLLATRIVDAADVAPLHEHENEDAWWLYHIWHEEEPDRLREHLAATVLARAPEDILKFVGCALGVAWSLETGAAARGEFREDHYEALAEMVPVDEVADAARAMFGEELDDPDYYGEGGRSPTRSLAHQFMVVHQRKCADGETSEGAFDGDAASSTATDG